MFSGLAFVVLLLSFVVLAIMMTPSLMEGILDRIPVALLDKKLFMGIYAGLICAVLYPVFVATTTTSGTCEECQTDCKNQFPDPQFYQECIDKCTNAYGQEACPAVEVIAPVTKPAAKEAAPKETAPSGEAAAKPADGEAAAK